MRITRPHSEPMPECAGPGYLDVDWHAEHGCLRRERVTWAASIQILPGELGPFALARAITGWTTANGLNDFAELCVGLFDPAHSFQQKGVTATRLFSRIARNDRLI